MGSSGESVIERVDVAVCRMWHMHERLGEEVNAVSCASLINSIRTHGQRHPVLARRVAGESDFEFELIYGARRLFAARQLGVNLVVDIRSLDDRGALIEMDIENRHRTDVSPYERGLSYRRWLNARHFSSQVEMARALGVSESQVCRLLKYTELPAAVVGAFAAACDIREDWAVSLARQCQNPKTRHAVIRRARERATSGSSEPAEVVYGMLMYGDSRRTTGLNTRDKVVKDARGQPLLRIGLRAKTVHFILPRARVTDDMLLQISENLRTILEDVGGHGSVAGVPIRLRQGGASTSAPAAQVL